MEFVVGAAGLGGGLTPSTICFVSCGGLHSVGDRPWMTTAKQGLGFMDHRLCKWGSTSDWGPLFGPVETRLCVYPTCDDNSYREPGCSRVTAAGSAAEVAHVSQGTEAGSSKRVIRKYLIGKSYSDMEKIVHSFGGQKHRAKQLYQLVYTNKMRTIKVCAQIPKQLRDAMESGGWSIGRSPVHHIATSIDGTVKMLLKPCALALTLKPGESLTPRRKRLRNELCIDGSELRLILFHSCLCNSGVLPGSQPDLVDLTIDIAEIGPELYARIGAAVLGTAKSSECVSRICTRRGFQLRSCVFVVDDTGYRVVMVLGAPRNSIMFRKSIRSWYTKPTLCTVQKCRRYLRPVMT